MASNNNHGTCLKTVKDKMIPIQEQSQELKLRQVQFDQKSDEVSSTINTQFDEIMKLLRDLHSKIVGESTPRSSHMYDESNNGILLISIHCMLYPITEEVLDQVFSPYGVVEKIGTIHKYTGLQALVHYQSRQSAMQARQSLQGRCIYDNCCELEIQFANSEVHGEVNRDLAFRNGNCENKRTSTNNGGGSTPNKENGAPPACENIASVVTNVDPVNVNMDSIYGVRKNVPMQTTPNIVNSNVVKEPKGLDQVTSVVPTQISNAYNGYHGCRIESSVLDRYCLRKHAWKCKQYFKMYKVPLDQQIQIAIMHLVHGGIPWYHGFTDGKDNVSWNDLVIELCPQFGADWTEATVEKFSKFKQHIRACSQGEFSSKEAKDRIICSTGRIYEGKATSVKGCERITSIRSTSAEGPAITHVYSRRPRGRREPALWLDDGWSHFY